MSTAVQHAPSPMPFFETIHAYQRTAALWASIDLDLFSHLALRGPLPAAELGQATGAHPKGIRVLCDYLVLCGLLTKTTPSPDWTTHLWANTPDSQLFLDRQSPASLTGSVAFLGSPDVRPAVDTLLAAVRKGGTPHESSVEGENPAWVDFARHMVPILLPAADRLPDLLGIAQAGSVRVLDIAAGHGMFGIRCAQANPQAHVTGLDWKSVLAVAKENAHKLGVADRYATIEGSAFEVDWKGPYDCILLPNFLHHFDFETNVELLKKTQAALQPGGRVAVLEFVPNDDRISPPAAAGFVMIMLRETAGGDAYTFRELSAMLTQAGFKDVEQHPLNPHPETWVVGRA